MTCANSKENKSESIPKRYFGLLQVAFAIFLAVLLAPTQHSSFFGDDRISFLQASKIEYNAGAIWGLNANRRRHPVFFLLLFFESKMFGPNPFWYFAVLFFIHFLNSVLVVKLARRCGADYLSALLGGLLFLCSSSSFQSLIFIPSTVIQLSLLFSLLGIHAWMDLLAGVRYSYAKTLFFLALSLLSYEAGMVFPLLAILLTWLYVPGAEERKTVVLKFVMPMVLITISLVCFLLYDFSLTRDFTEKFSAQALHLLPLKLLSLVNMLLGSLFMPANILLILKTLDYRLTRILPILLCGSFGVVFLMRKKLLTHYFYGISPRLITLGGGWIGVSVLPYLATQWTFEHASRYLYFATVGFCMVFGVFAGRVWYLVDKAHSRTARIFCASVLCYLLGQNVLSTAFHYERYQQYLLKHPRVCYNEQVRSLFAES